MEYLKGFAKALPVGIVITIILVIIIVILTVLGIAPLWPAFFCLFFFTTAGEMDIKRVPALAISGALGLFGGFIGILVPDETMGTVLLLLWLCFILVLGQVNPKIPFIDSAFAFLFLTVATAITGICKADPALNIWVSYLAGIVLMLIIGGIMYAVAQRAAKKAAEAGAGEAAEVAEAAEAPAIEE